MAIPSSGPLSLTDIQTEFGGSNPIGLSEYYAGGGLVPAGTTGTYGAVPSSGTISIQNFYGTANVYNINNSLRFRSSASAYLNRTFTTPTSQNRWTYSTWVKPSLYYSATYALFGLNSASDNNGMGFDGSNNSQFIWFGSSVNFIKTTQVFRDPSAWYHIVLAVDSAASGTNKIRFYVNGVEVTSFSSDGRASFSSSNVNTASVHAIGRRQWDGTQYYDGLQGETYFVDGQQLTPSSFGETSTTTGSWIPKAYTGTYGTNGFYLKFSTIALTSGSNTGLGQDFSGNGNYWNTNNISVTSGVTYDAMTDSPTPASATVGNYPIAIGLVPFRTWTNYQNGNLTINNGNVNSNQVAVSNMAFGTGKYYWETTITALGAGATIGVMKVENISGSTTTIDIGSAAGTYAYLNGGNKSIDGTFSAYGSSYTTNDVIAFTYDGSTGVLTAYKNNVSQGTMTTLSTAFQYVCGWGCNNTTSTSTHNINFGQRPFTYTPPTGFVRLNTFNLPTPTILQGNKYMDATLYTGTGASLSVTNAGGFKPDLVWVKGRSGATDHAWYDSVRGVQKQLESNTTTAETTETTGLTAFGTSGFTVGALAQMNTSAATYVGWQWQAGQGTTSSNTDGSITSTVSVNATAGFSIVTYTGNNTASTVGHGLGVAPSFIISKCRSSGVDSWTVYHQSLGNTRYILLNSTAAQVTAAPWNNTSPTSTVFSIGGGSSWGTNISGGLQLAYCWAEIAGFSKFGSYTGNGSTNGTFVYLGFRPKYLLVKRTNVAQEWNVYDAARNLANATNNILVPNSASTEFVNDTVNLYDFLSNGFKARGTSGATNINGSTYIYAAFAENPFKNANAR